MPTHTSTESIKCDQSPRQGGPVTPPDSFYDAAHFEHLFAVEHRHAWFRARNELIGELAAGFTDRFVDGFLVLEVGCGTGAVLQVLEQSCARGHVVGMDVHHAGLRFARQRTASPLVVGDATTPPFGRTFALVGLYDVIEHLPDDRGVLEQMHELLVPGGGLMLTVPADPALWSYFDVASQHVRRYELEELHEKLSTAGFTVEYATYFMTALRPLLWAYRRLLSAVPSSQSVERDLRTVPVVNELLYWILTRERSAIRARRELQTGTSILAIARQAE